MRERRYKARACSGPKGGSCGAALPVPGAHGQLGRGWGRGGGLLGPLAAAWLITLQKPGAGPGLNEASVF